MSLDGVPIPHGDGRGSAFDAAFAKLLWPLVGINTDIGHYKHVDRREKQHRHNNNLSGHLPVSFCVTATETSSAVCAEYKHTVRDYRWDKGCRHGW